jgi:glutathione S-transferase
VITVHHLSDSRSQRILWLLEELGLPYEVLRYERDPLTMRAPAALRAVHPLGKSPVVTDAQRTFAESGAIVEYLIERYGDGRLIPPPGSVERDRYRYWLHYAEGSAMPPLLVKLILDRVAAGPSPWPASLVARGIARRVEAAFTKPQLAAHLDHIEAALAAHAWFAGDEFTAADIQMSFPLEVAARRAGLDATRPRASAFLERIHAREAYRRALRRGGAYALAAEA